ncbi:unnamed protein product, partial [Effrenium voratum]
MLGIAALMFGLGLKMTFQDRRWIYLLPRKVFSKAWRIHFSVTATFCQMRSLEKAAVNLNLALEFGQREQATTLSVRFGSEPEKVVKAVEWIGVKNQVQAFLKGGVAGKRVAMISTMGTSTPPTKGNKVMFYKLLAESYLSSAGVSFAIVKPCGLTDAPGGDRLLMAGHDDEESWFSEGFYMIPRADVANATASALLDAPADTMRFDLCAK